MMPPAIAFWFAASILAEFANRLVLKRWLGARHITIAFLKRGMLGIYDYAYVRWCRDNGRPFKTFIFLRSLLALNTILACITFIAYCNTLPKDLHFSHGHVIVAPTN